MKRKALTLQHNNTHTQLKKSMLYIKAVKNQNRMNNRFMQYAKPEVCHRDIYSSASQSDVPGNKGFILYDNPNTPIYNYIPVKRTYQGGNNKYPYTAWKYGMQGFPVGKKGSSPESRRAAQEELARNPEKYSRSTNYNGCFNTLCSTKSIKFKFNINISNILSISGGKDNIDLLSGLNNTTFTPIYLNPEYTDIGLEGQVWYHTKKASTTSSSTSSSTSNTSDLSYIHFLTNYEGNWWYSISKNNQYNITNINDSQNLEYKELVNLIYASYPFIEFQLTIKSAENNKYKFNVSKIYLQTGDITSNVSDISLINVIPNKLSAFRSNYCILNSPTKLYVSNNIKPLDNTFWWRLNQAEGTANLFNYDTKYKNADINSNKNLTSYIYKYYSICTTQPTFSGEFTCQ
tara:strand:- start:132 stop:1340 length:1209 start_codon:yes stop_codon:yes gene_type:complete